MNDPHRNIGGYHGGKEIRRATMEDGKRKKKPCGT
jgi:hypothetical protein